MLMTSCLPHLGHEVRALQASADTRIENLRSAEQPTHLHENTRSALAGAAAAGATAGGGAATGAAVDAMGSSRAGGAEGVVASEEHPGGGEICSTTPQWTHEHRGWSVAAS